MRRRASASNWRTSTRRIELPILDDERRTAAAEIENDVAALNLGLQRLTDLPVSLRLLRQIHARR